MSRYAEFVTELRDENFLVCALKAMGFEIECHATPQTLFGYHGDARPEKANVIIRRQNTGIGASNDIGFVRDGIGKPFRAIISEYDDGAKFDARWMGLLKQRYTEEKTIATARQKGYRFDRREEIDTEKGKSVRLLFSVRG
jgi:hypothetical protein